MSKEIKSVTALVIELGGPTKAAEILGCATPQKVVNWRAAGKLPARLHIIHRKRLADLGIVAPPSLWGLVEDSAA